MPAKFSGEDETAQAAPIDPSLNEMNDELVFKSFRMRILLLLSFALFTGASIGHSYLQSELFDPYATQMSVQQSLSKMVANARDSSDPSSIDQFWVWLAYLRLQVIE